MNPAALSKAILEVHEARGFDDLPRAMLGAAARVLDFDAAGYNEFDTWKDQVRNFHTCGEAAVKLLPAFNAHLHEHPTYAVIKGSSARQLTPVRWSDYVTLREFRQTGLHHEYFRKIGIHYQMGIGLIWSSRFVVSLSFNRENREFSEDDCDRLTLLAPHLVQAFRQQKEHLDFRQMLHLHQAASESEAIAVVDSTGRLTIDDDHVHRLLGAYFRLESGPMLPAPLRRWLLDPEARKTAFQIQGPRAELRVLPPRSIPCGLIEGLAIRDPLPGEQWLLRFVEIAEHECIAKLRSLGLTPREAQVMRWIGEGKRNTEIGAILGMQPRTVEKHCEHIFEKLGLENRGAACAFSARV